jgi:hypothetical protein
MAEFKALSMSIIISEILISRKPANSTHHPAETIKP